MFTLDYTTNFKRRMKKLPIEVVKSFFAKREMLEANPFNPALKTHKLGGNMRPFWSFSVDYQYRAVFKFDGNKIILLITIGSHDIYKEIL